MFDLVIIGAGPAGIACGIEAQKAGLNYLILEKGFLVNSLYHFPTNMTFFSTSQKLEIGDVPFISHSDKPSRQEALEYYRRIVENYKLNVRFKAEVKDFSRNNGIHKIHLTSGDIFETRHVIIATGYYGQARMLGVPGEDLPKVKHYYDDAHPYIGMNILVIGAANSACDVALETWQKGAHVTMVIRENQLYQKVKYWILPNIENRIKEGSIKAYFNSSVTEIKEQTVNIKTPDGEVELDNDYVLAMTGYQPDFDFMEKAGIQFNDEESYKPIINPETLESNIEGIYLAGVVVSGRNTSELFIENTRNHGRIIINHITSTE
ncbi:MAG: YpdA family putative bacillithiol disulfide reductase [Bacteroidia bacterium]|nr:YpdA family putative bacillithiol disulfide reductase [Bacteroidia bacterium]